MSASRISQTSLPSHPIGVFDSGVGGLTVVRALMDRLPFENIIYFGDTARVPYGVKSVATIEHYTQQIADFLQQQDVKMLIIACNTMAAVAADKVRASAKVPVLDVIEAGAKNAVAHTKTGGIGVIGTPTTINSNAYARAIHQLNPSTRVYSQSCPLFVPLVEEGWLDHAVTRLTAQEYLKPVFVEAIDTLVLGCTHYPLIKPLLMDVCGNETQGKRMQLVDSALSIADQTAEILQTSGLANPAHTMPEYRFVVTDLPVKFQTIGERFLGRSLGKIELTQL